MYQIKCQCGYEIHRIGKGENGLSRVERDNVTRFTGTYAQCVAWLSARAVKTLG